MANPNDLIGNVTGMRALMLAILEQVAKQGRGQDTVHEIYAKAISILESTPTLTSQADAIAFVRGLAPTSFEDEGKRQ